MSAMRVEKLKWKDGFKPRPGVLQSFEGTPRFYRIHGPAEFCRLVQFEKTLRTGESLDKSRPDGQFWFHQDLIDSLRVQARSDLRASRTSTSAPNKALAALYLRFCLRGALAVSKDWTHDFDAYVKVSLAKSDSLIALVGKVKGQPYYSESSPDHKKAADAGITLEGKAWQYVIDFGFGENQARQKNISGPFRLEGW